MECWENGGFELIGRGVELTSGEVAEVVDSVLMARAVRRGPLRCADDLLYPSKRRAGALLAWEFDGRYSVWLPEALYYGAVFEAAGEDGGPLDRDVLVEAVISVLHSRGVSVDGETGPKRTYPGLDEEPIEDHESPLAWRDQDGNLWRRENIDDERRWWNDMLNPGCNQLWEWCEIDRDLGALYLVPATDEDLIAGQPVTWEELSHHDRLCMVRLLWKGRWEGSLREAIQEGYGATLPWENVVLQSDRGLLGNAGVLGPKARQWEELCDPDQLHDEIVQLLRPHGQA